MKKIESSLSTLLSKSRVDTINKQNQEFANVFKFLEVIKLLVKMDAYLGESDRSAAPENYDIAYSVFRLLEAIAYEDREAYFQADLKDIATKLNKKIMSQEEVNILVNQLKVLYGFSDKQFEQQINKFNLIKYGVEYFSTSKITKDYYDPDTNVYLYAFTKLALREEHGRFIVKMLPLYDGGIDDVASPLHELEFLIESGKPVTTNFEKRFHILRAAYLDKELQNHPLLMAEMKKRFAQIIDSYTTNFDEFIEERKGVNRNDSSNTYLHDYFFEFAVKQYLKNKMKSKDYQVFERNLSFSNSDLGKSVVILRVLSENFFSNTVTSFRNPQRWEMQNRPNELLEIITETKSALIKLGCKFDEDQITNIDEIINQCRNNREFAKKVVNMYDSLLKLCESRGLSTVSYDIKIWLNLYQDDVTKKIITAALEASRKK